MNETISLGQSALQALRFMDMLYTDIGKMIKALDEALEKQAWYAAHKYRNRVSGVIGNRLDDEWLARAIYRIYGPQPKRDKAKKAIAICVTLEPPEEYDEPVCLVMAVQFPTLTSYIKIWEGWDADDNLCGSDRVLSFLKDKVEPQQLGKDLLHRDLFSGADDGVALAIPLCDINDSEALNKKLVEPIVKAANALRSRS